MFTSFGIKVAGQSFIVVVAAWGGEAVPTGNATFFPDPSFSSLLTV